MNKNKFYAWLIPSNNSNIPSMKFNVEGYLNDDEAEELRRQSIGSIVVLVEFKSRQDYDKHLEEIDNNFFEEEAEEYIDQAGGWL